MVNVDEKLALADGGTGFAEALDAGGVGGDDAIKLQAGPGFLDKFLRVKKGEFLRQPVLVPASHRLTLVAEGEGQTEL